MEESTIESFEYWRAYKGNCTNINEAFDAFNLSYSLYNKLYKEIALYMESKGEVSISAKNAFPEAKGAIDYVVGFVGSKRLRQLFENDSACKASVESFIRIIENQEFNIKLSTARAVPDRKSDLELLEKLKSSNPNIAVKGIFEFIYAIRCNIVHGEKTRAEVQLDVLCPVILLLTKVIPVIYYKLERLENSN